jgi:predicted MPP superfamily phosphohydrolase
MQEWEEKMKNLTRRDETSVYMPSIPEMFYLLTALTGRSENKAVISLLHKPISSTSMQASTFTEALLSGYR